MAGIQSDLPGGRVGIGRTLEICLRPSHSAGVEAEDVLAGACQYPFEQLDEQRRDRRWIVADTMSARAGSAQRRALIRKAGGGKVRGGRPFGPNQATPIPAVSSSTCPENVGSRFLSLLQSAADQTLSAIFGTAKKPNCRRHSRVRLGGSRAERYGKSLSECRFKTCPPNSFASTSAREPVGQRGNRRPWPC